MLSGKVAIVTGASSGIGRACAIEYAKHGCDVVLVARNLERLQNVEKECQKYNAQTLIVQADITEENECKKIIDKTIEKFNKIDVLVNNAGLSMRAMFNDVGLDVIKRLIDVNLWGTIYCTKYALPYLLKAEGSLIGVISIAGFRGLPGRTGYSAAKFAVNGFLESLRTEHLKDNIHIMVVAPGFTASNIRFAALTTDGSEQGESPRDEGKMMTPERVAKKIVKYTWRRKRYVIMSAQGKGAYWLNKFFPGFMDYMTYKHMSKEPKSPF